jgi:hypothetical protein
MASVVGLDDPGFATKGAKQTKVGFLVEELLERADTTAAKGGKTVSRGSGSVNCFTPPFLGKV